MIQERNVEMAMLSRSVRHTVGRIARENDIWPVDPPYHLTGEPGGYDSFFNDLLEKENADSFEILLSARKDDRKPTNVLDLFGSGYFINDLSVADSITGVRLLNTKAATLKLLQSDIDYGYAEEEGKLEKRAMDQIEKVTASSKWSQIEGNLFLPTTWNALDKNAKQRGIPSFDLITIKPEGAIHNFEVFAHGDLRPENRDYEWRDRIYSLKFLRLLNRAYQRLNPDDGQLYTEVPQFITERYLDDFKEMLLTEGKIQTDIVDSRYQPWRKNMRMTRYPESVPDLEALTKKQISSKAVIFNSE